MAEHYNSDSGSPAADTKVKQSSLFMISGWSNIGYFKNILEILVNKAEVDEKRGRLVTELN